MRNFLNKKFYILILFLISLLCTSCSHLYVNDFNKIVNHEYLLNTKNITITKNNKLCLKNSKDVFTKNIMDSFTVMEEIEKVSTTRMLVCLLLNIKDTGLNKIKISIIANNLESKYDRDVIMYVLLSHAFFGHGKYGIEDASKFYFNKNANSLNLAESVLLATIIKRPNLFSPVKNPRIAFKRHREYLLFMAKKGLITNDMADKTYLDFWPEYLNIVRELY